MAFVNSLDSNIIFYNNNSSSNNKSNRPSLKTHSALPSPLLTSSLIPPAPYLLEISDIRQNVNWIRDTLDPLVAREGSSVLDPDDALTVHAFLDRVRTQPFRLETIRQTRLYQTLSLIRGKATRWPRLIIDECDAVIEVWTMQFGSLSALRTPLYEKGGRLYGVCKAKDLSTGDLLRRFAKIPGQNLDDSRAMRQGHLGFLPGSWWINTTFAFRDGIITRSGIKGGVCAKNRVAYALVLIDFEEHDSPSPDSFKYVSRTGSLGASAIVSTFVKERAPIRVLRSHKLQSLWSPIVGIRYDGLYNVKGWSVIPSAEGKMRYIIKFERQEGQVAMLNVLSIPKTSDREDYQEFYRIRALSEKARRKKKNLPEVPSSTGWEAVSRDNPMLANRFVRNPQSQKTSGDGTVGSSIVAAAGMADATLSASGTKGGSMPDMFGEVSGSLRAKMAERRGRSFGTTSSDKMALVRERKMSLQVDGSAVVFDDDDEDEEGAIEAENSESSEDEVEIYPLDCVETDDALCCLHTPWSDKNLR